MPRLHPDDLKELSDSISNTLKEEINTLYNKEYSISKLQTFTVKEVSKILVKNKSTVLRWLEKGTLEGTKRGKEWIITQKNLEDYINGKQ